MPAQLPYLPSNRNVPKLFEKIDAAKIPEKFNHTFLQQTIGLKSTNDRALIPLLRNLGFIDQSGTPTASYALLKGDIAPPPPSQLQQLKGRAARIAVQRTRPANK
jgi:hypothetical protein